MAKAPRSTMAFPATRLTWYVQTLPALIVVGAGVLKLPGMTLAGRPLSWLDALYTAASAGCLTGLAVRDAAGHFTPMGQAVLALIMQAGVLLIVAAGSLVAWRLSMAWDRSPPPRECQPTAVVGAALVAVLALETLGAVVLAAAWPGDFALGARLGLGIFHSISAVGNGGMTLLGGNLEGWRYSWLAHVVVLPLIGLGSAGLPACIGLWWANRHRDGDSPSRIRAGWRIYVRLALGLSGLLYVAGVILLMAAQLTPHSYAALGLGNSAFRKQYAPLTAREFGATMADASFASLSARSAGFRTMPMDELEPAARVALIPLMLVGGVPGGAAGGMSVFCAAALVVVGWSGLRGRGGSGRKNHVWAGRLSRAAMGVGLAYTGLLLAGAYLLSLFEPYPFLSLVFEAASALGSSGMTLLSSDLTRFGRGMMVVLMVAGRVLPLVILARAWPGRKLKAVAGT